MRTLLSCVLFLLLDITSPLVHADVPPDPGALNAQIAPRSIGPAGMSGRITAIDVVPDNKDIWYVGAASGGVWKTINAGTTFLPVFDQQPVQSIGAIAIAPSNPNVLYVGTGEGNPRNSQSSGNGIYKSYDGGDSWHYLGLPGSSNIHRLIVHPQNEQIVWAGVLGDPFNANETRGLYKSQDGGKSWKKILYSNARSGIADLVLDPSNPNKLIAALWEFRRSPWDSVSGGEGSGLFMTLDGGESWRELDSEAGLPQKPYGRIGVAIAPSQPSRVYALVESEKNAIYRSDNGGTSWELINTETIGSRPFYFAELHVDSQNENRVYNLYSRLARSENAGETFSVIEDWGREVHADHHAFWIDPDNPAFIIDGTDGGLYWSRDRGENWRFAENLPLGQFYHITLDNDVPYNIYGGLQDNGTWYGPSEVWHRAGIRNSYWRELAFNDGFDVVLDDEDADIVYALWQGGMLVRVNKRTGQRKTIAPVVSGKTLRFNWNAAIAKDPFDPGTVFLGSQFLHKSLDKGNTWSIISPDLTTNNPAKQRQEQSGGLSIDATAAENHTTLTVIAPSKLQEGLLWVGTDDGRLHLSRDKGTNWQDLTANIGASLPDAAEHGWIRQIVPSLHAVGSAFVVIDNHLQGDRSPYLLHTQDFGQSWHNLLKNKDVPAYALSFVQDPAEAKLMFVGTEFGLYYSMDAGEHWTQWRRGYPSVSTMDLKIHTRENDLVIGTFGRSLYVLDDLQPWRDLASEPDLKQQPLHLFTPPDTYQPVIKQARGQRLSPDNLYAGENNARQALISFWVNEPQTKSVEISIHKDGSRVRHWQQPVTQGLNRTHWDLQWSGEEIYGPLMSPDLEMPLAEPGTYRVLITAGTLSAEGELQLLADPGVNYDPLLYAANTAFRHEIEMLKKQMLEVKKTLACMETRLPLIQDHLQHSTAEAISEGIDRVWSLIEHRRIQGVISHSPRLAHQLSRAFYYTHSPYEALNEGDRALLSTLEQQVAQLQGSFERFRESTWNPALEGMTATQSTDKTCREQALLQ